MITAADKSFEIVFLSSDKDEANFASYYKEMPWLGVPFDRRDVKNDLSKQRSVTSLPSSSLTVILDPSSRRMVAVSS